MFYCKSKLLHSLGHRNSHGHGRADHRIVAHAQEAHHLHMRRDGAGAGKLRVAVHTAHGVGHAVGSGTGGHIVRMQRTAGAAAGGYGEVLLALLDALLLIGTGYGRNKVPFADENISEISCHAMGVHVTDPSVKAIIDIGGQDVKGIAIDTDGTVKNFAMNDKCAAGTGRFFEAMANAFEMSLPDFCKLSLQAKNTIPITAQCTVFAESEVISLVGEGKPMDEIAAGIQLAVAKRCFVMAKKAGATDSITLTGGCAKNEGLKRAIEHVLKIKVVDLPIDPQLMGALGAAEYARQKGMA